MSKNPPNKFIAPIVIAGITIGFLASAYKFVFAKPQSEEQSDVARKPKPTTEIVEKTTSDIQPEI